MKKVSRLAAAAAVVGSLVSNLPANAASKKIWYCHAVCVGVDSYNKQVRLVGDRPPEGFGAYRMNAWDELSQRCAQGTANMGMPEAVLASRFSYKTAGDRSSSKSWSVYAKDSGNEASSSTHQFEGADSSSRSGVWHYDSSNWEKSSDTEDSSQQHDQERSRSGSVSFSSHDELTLSLDPASMRDPDICSQEDVDSNWIPYYQPLPGENGWLG